MPDFSDLHLLTILSQTRSFTAAARRLDISKASVSMRIAQLEKSAGVPLVSRSTRSVSLTKAGVQLVEDTLPAFARIEQSFSNIKDLSDKPRGLVRLTAPVALGRQRIAPALASFFDEYPEIAVDIDLNDRIVNLTQEGFDLAIRHSQDAPDTHIAWTLCPSSALLVATRSYLKLHGTPAHPADLANHRCLQYLRSATDNNWVFERAVPRRQSERVVVAVNGPLRANNSEVLREAVLAGMGIGLLPDFSAQEQLGSRKLVAVLPEWKSRGTFGEHIYAIRPWAPQVPRAVQCLVTHLRKSMGVS